MTAGWLLAAGRPGRAGSGRPETAASSGALMCPQRAYN